MRAQPWTVCDSDVLGNAHQLMTRNHIRHLPVVSDGALVGMLSERDIFAARARAEEDDWSKLSVRDAMQRPVLTCHPEESLTQAAARLASAKIGALPVVELGKLIGLVTVTDVLDAEVRAAMAATPPVTRTGYAR